MRAANDPVRAFVRRRSSAVTEAVLIAVVIALLAALTGMTAQSEPPDPASLARADKGPQVLVGVMTSPPAGDEADDMWTAVLKTGDRTVTIRISHEAAHQLQASDGVVQVEGAWSSDGTFVAAAIDPVDPNAVAVAVDGSTDVAAVHPAPPKTGKLKTLEGVLSFRHGDDFASGRKTPTRYFLTDADGETELAFSHAPSGKLAGTKVRVTGVQDGMVLDVADGGTTTVAASTATSSSTGGHRVAVVLFNFSNDTSQPYTPAVAAGIAFNNSDSVAAYYAENSWGQLTLSGDVLGWYTIPDTNANCAYSTWANSAGQAAAAAGHDLSGYDNVVYAFPSTSCGWAGLANMPGRNSWLNGGGAMTLRVMAHELGHNFGTHHASQLNCTEGGVRVSLSASMSNCTSGEYGDPFTVMGQATRYHHTNFARANYGWLAPSNTTTATASGDFLLAPVEFQDTSAVTALRIQRTSSSWVTMEFRQPYGSSFETFAGTAPVATGVTIHITPSYTTRAQSQLVDATPATTSFIDAPLGVGLTFTDPLTGVSITTLGTSSSGALVRISFGSGGPTPSPSPTPTPSPTPGTSADPSPTPGPTASPTPTATPSPTATPTPTPTATPTPTPTATPSPTATPTPTPTDSVAPTAPGNLKASVARSKKVALSWVASTDNVRVSGYRVYRDGTLVATTANTKWTDPVTYKGGSRLYDVVAFDTAGNVSPDAEVVVQ